MKSLGVVYSNKTFIRKVKKLIKSTKVKWGEIYSICIVRNDDNEEPWVTFGGDQMVNKIFQVKLSEVLNIKLKWWEI